MDNDALNQLGPWGVLLVALLGPPIKRMLMRQARPSVSSDGEAMGPLGAQMEELLRLVQATDEAAKDRHLSVMREMAATQQQVETGYQSLTRQVDTYRAEVQRLAAS